jgi:formamidopyrimidine-DNA glycosylase
VPELAEVESFRRRWDAGFGKTIRDVTVHAKKRVFRNMDILAMRQALRGSKLVASETHGKQMLFGFSRGAWLGVHLGMTGTLRVETLPFTPGRHDHLVLHQNRRALVFNDPRQFGRVRFHRGGTEPAWWSNLPPRLDSPAFTHQVMTDFLQRHRRLPVKAALLLQRGFPGIGNWMADEILWRARLNPRASSGAIRGRQSLVLWKMIRFVCQGAMRHVSLDYSDPPKGWLFNERWRDGGKCPIHQMRLRRETVGGRTTAWCPDCQR